MIICGEGLVDLVPQDGSPNLVPALGGGPFNVAIAAARLGADVQFCSRLSTDAFGTQLVERLQTEDVDTSLVQRGEEPTTLALTSLLPDGSAEYVFYIEGTADRLADPISATRGKTFDIACFGTVSLALEPAASRYIQLAKDLAAAGTFVALDPNIRPFYATEQHKARILDLIAHVQLLKLSEDEDEFLGNPKAPIKIVTRGGDGLDVFVGDEHLHVTPPAITVADTIGAGDTVMGALLAEIQRRGQREYSPEQWAEIAQFAANAAAVTCTRTGAQPPRRSEVPS